MEIINFNEACIRILKERVWRVMGTNEKLSALKFTNYLKNFLDFVF